MIIASIKKLEIGSKSKGLTDDKGDYHDIPFLILAEATEEDYWKQVEEYGGEREVFDEQVFFYKVSID